VDETLKSCSAAIGERKEQIEAERTETDADFCVYSRMQEVHLLRVITDGGERQIWLAVTDRERAIDEVLDIIPEGWTVSLIERGLSAEHAASSNMKPGESGSINCPNLRWPITQEVRLTAADDAPPAWTVNDECPAGY